MSKLIAQHYYIPMRATLFSFWEELFLHHCILIKFYRCLWEIYFLDDKQLYEVFKIKVYKLLFTKFFNKFRF